LAKSNLAAIFVVLIFMAPAVAWFDHSLYINGFDDFKFEMLGPRIDEIQIKIYPDQNQEFLAFKNKQIDIMNEPLTLAQREELESLDPNMSNYSRALMIETEMFEIDFNNQRFPTNDVWFRRAVSHLLDREAYIASQSSWWYGMGEAVPAYSPLSHLENANHTGWYNPYCTNIYPFNPTTAAQILDSHGYLDVNEDGWREGPSGENVTLIFYVRGDDPNRIALGDQLTYNLQIVLSQQPPSFAGIRVDERIRRRFEDQIFVPVMQHHEYHMYTGHWWFTSGNYLPTRRDPASLVSFTSKYSYMWFLPSNLTMNYLLYRNPWFDEEVHLMMEAQSISGEASTPPWPEASAKHHCWEAQRIIMDDAALIPVVNRGGHKSYLSEWKHIINQINQGVNSRWSFLNMYKGNTSWGGTVKYGFMKDVESLNPVTAQSPEIGGYGTAWNWDVLSEIYETLITWNPYDSSIDLPNLCKSWTVGNWTYEQRQCSVVTFRLREDIYWQDVPPKSNRKYSILPNGRVAKLLTAEDVKFTIEYILNCSAAVNQPLLVNWSTIASRNYGFMNVVNVETPDPFTVRVYYDEYAPWSALHLVGALPILPKDIWENVPISEIATYDPWVEDTLYGTGQFILVERIPGVSMTLKAWRKGLNYKDITASTEFYNDHLVLAYVERLPRFKEDLIESGKLVNFSVVLKNLAEFPVTVQYRVDYDNSTIHSGSVFLANASQNGNYFNFTFSQVLSFGSRLDFPPKPDGGEGTPWQADLFRPLHFIRVAWNVSDPLPVTGYESTWSNTVYEYLYVRIPGDVNGDKIVNILDCIVLANHFRHVKGDGHTPDTKEWTDCMNCDINSDGTVNILDCIILAGNFGQSWI